MRIISGQYGGRIIKTPKLKGTRPMTEKMRAALFDVVGDVNGFDVVDAYAGSGAVGFEAISRGANLVVGIESIQRAASLIKKNETELGIEFEYILYASTVESWLARWGEQHAGKYDLVVADPPYEQLEEDVLEKLGTLLRPGGILAVSHSPKKHPVLSGVELIKSKNYGDSALSFYKR